jgi:hypothetical protein
MVYFSYQKSLFWNLFEGLVGIFYGHLVCLWPFGVFMAIFYTFSYFCMLCQDKSGNTVWRDNTPRTNHPTNGYFLNPPALPVEGNQKNGFKKSSSSYLPLTPGTYITTEPG